MALYDFLNSCILLFFESGYLLSTINDENIRKLFKFIHIAVIKVPDADLNFLTYSYDSDHWSKNQMEKNPICLSNIIFSIINQPFKTHCFDQKCWKPISIIYKTTFKSCLIVMLLNSYSTLLTSLFLDSTGKKCQRALSKLNRYMHNLLPWWTSTTWLC